MPTTQVQVMNASTSPVPVNVGGGKSFFWHYGTSQGATTIMYTIAGLQPTQTFTVEYLHLNVTAPPSATVLLTIHSPSFMVGAGLVFPLTLVAGSFVLDLPVKIPVAEGATFTLSQLTAPPPTAGFGVTGIISGNVQ
jgi:hypothetical protein